MEKKRASTLAILAFPLFFVLVAAVLILFGDSLAPLFRDKAAIRSWIEARGILGAGAFVLLQILQVVVFVLPGEIVQIAGGFAFGFGKGILLTLAGISIGSMFNYLVGRVLGRPFVEALFPAEKLAGIEGVLRDGKSLAGYFLLFVIPGIPKDALCYVGGMSRFPPVLFLLASMAGRLPGIAGSSFMGSSAYGGNLGLSIAVFAVSALCFGLGLLFRDRITSWLAGVFGRGGS
jgi:uncharacterized membrane protein YdjX (TVP38/TMEM64 family)